MEKTTNFLTDAFQLAVTTALGLKDFSKKSTEEVSKKRFQLQSKISDLSVDGLPEITFDQVSWHDSYDDCWIVLYDRVYDITEFLQEHPGGADVLVEYAGRDATLSFRGFGHSLQAWQLLQKYLIGILPEEERSGIFKEDKFFGINQHVKAASS